MAENPEITQEQTREVSPTVEEAQGVTTWGPNSPIPRDVVPLDWVEKHLGDFKEFLVVRDGQMFLEGLPSIPVNFREQTTPNSPIGLCRVDYWNSKKQRQEGANVGTARINGVDMRLSFKLELIGWPFNRSRSGSTESA